MLLRPDDKSGAIVDSFLCDIVGNPGATCNLPLCRSPDVRLGGGNRPAAVIKTEMKSEQLVANEQKYGKMIQLKLSHNFCGKVAGPQRNIGLANVVRHDSALGIAILKRQRARFSSLLQRTRQRSRSQAQETLISADCEVVAIAEYA